MEKPTLIAAASLDEHAYGPVSSILEQRGFPVIVYRTDMVLTDEERLCVDIGTDGELEISYDNRSIAPDSVSAAWCRKIGNFTLPNAAQDRAKQLYINNEIKYLHDTIWPLYPEDIWLNSPDRMRQADRKLGQLLVAHELGFSIPETVVSSSWEDISSRLLSENQQMVVKMVRGVINENDKIKALFTTLLDEAKVEEIRDTTTPFPGIYQPFIEKAREWRVTTVGDRVFAAAIYTNDEAKDDWRKHQLDPSLVEFRSEDFPDDLKEKCIKYLGKMGLKFGAFDFIEKPDGEIVFLECNPNGQYGWLEEALDLPISEAIADELVKIAKSR